MYSSQKLKQIAIFASFVMGISTNAMAGVFYNEVDYTYATTVDPKVKSDVVIEKPKFLTIIETSEKMFHSDADIFCMAKNIYHEAGAEPELGKYAVAQVTINRMKNPLFPKHLCDVVFEPQQFSWANDSETHWTRPAGPDWEESKKVARDVIVGGKRVQGMDKALFFHEKSISPIWANAKRKVVQIGSHIFYRSIR